MQKEEPCGPTAAQQVGALSLRGQVGYREASGGMSLQAVAFHVLPLACSLQVCHVCFAVGLPLTASA